MRAEPLTSGPAKEILAIARAHRDNFDNDDSDTAEQGIPNMQLRHAIMNNSRLHTRLRARRAAGGAVALPDRLPPFPEAACLLHVLRSESDLAPALGLAWHGNDLSRVVLRGRKTNTSLPDFPRDQLRKALAVRHLALAANGHCMVPPHTDLKETGTRCLAAWIGALPPTAAMIALELGTIPETMIRQVADEPLERRLARRAMTAAWLGLNKTSEQNA